MLYYVELMGILVHTDAYQFSLILYYVELLVIPLHTSAYQFSLILYYVELLGILVHTSSYQFILILYYVELLGILVHTSAYRIILVHTSGAYVFNSRQCHSITCTIMSYCKALLVHHCHRNCSPRTKFVYFNPLITT